MKSIFPSSNGMAVGIFCILLGGFCSVTPYTTRYDDVDLDEVLANERLLSGYVNCLLDKGPCTPDGRELRKNLPDAINNECKNCTEKQRLGSEKVTHYIIDHNPADWEQLEQKYHSDGSYKKNYLEKKKVDESSEDAHEEKNDNKEDTENEKEESKISPDDLNT